MKNLHVRLHSKMKMVHQLIICIWRQWKFRLKINRKSSDWWWHLFAKKCCKKIGKLPAHTHTIKERIRNISIHLFSDSNLQYEKCHFPAQCFTKRSLDVYNCSSSSCCYCYCCCWWYYYLFFCLFVVCISFIGFLLL